MTPDPLPNQNLTVGISNSTLNLDIDAAAVFPVDFDIYPLKTYYFSVP